VPAHNRIGRYNHQSLLPGRPKAVQEHPEKFICGGESGTGVLALEHRQLLTQGEIFDQQTSAGAKQPQKDTQPQMQKTVHGWNS